MVSYTITACNEDRDLDKLLNYMCGSIVDSQPSNSKIKDGDEIIIQIDQSNHTDLVKKVADHYVSNYSYVKLIEFPLNKDFATFKNNLKNHCSNEWIFNIDADEMPALPLLENLHEILLSNAELDVIIVPRWNVVEGITEEHISKWRWKYDDWGRINWPDWQMRIYRNDPKINWVNKVHEKLDGFSKYTFLPEEKEYCLFHNKTIDRQENQNNFYNTI